MFRKKFFSYFLILTFVVSQVFGFGFFDVSSVSAIENGSWGEVNLLESLDGTIPQYDAKIASDDSGNVIAIWAQTDTSTSYRNTYVSFYNGNAWESTPLIIDADTAAVGSVSISMKSNGDAIATWKQNSQYYYSLYTSDSNWSQDDWSVPQVIPDTLNAYDSAVVEYLSTGEAIFAFNLFDTAISVYTTKYTNGSWSTPTTRESSSNGATMSLDLKADTLGNAMLVWSQYANSFGPYILQYSYYDNSLGEWSSSSTVAAGQIDAGGANSGEVVFDSSGNAWVTWVRTSLYVSRFDVGTKTFEANTYLASSPTRPQITVDSSDNPIVMWSGSDNIYIRKYTSSAWSSQTSIGTYSGIVPFQDLDTDNNGSAIAIWTANSTSYVSYYDGTNWLSSPRELQTSSGYDSYPKVTFDGLNNAHVLIQGGIDLYSGFNNLFTSKFTYNETPTLTSLSATPSTDGTGNVSIVSTVNDADANELSIAYYYEQTDTCGASLPSTTSTISTVTSENGTAVTSTGSYQVTTVTTTPGANTVTSTWATLSDGLSEANGTYCIYAYAYDGTVTSTMATTTVILDNVAPSTPAISSFTLTSTTEQATWSAVSGTSFYTVSSTAGTSVTTTATNYTYGSSSALTPNTSYSWQLKSTDSYSNASSYSTATLSHRYR